MSDNFIGMPYPLRRHPHGFMHPQKGLDQVKSDLLILLLTNQGERVMLPEFGTSLRKFIFEPNDPTVEDQVKEEIIRAISRWEPRIKVDAIEVTSSFNRDELNPDDTLENLDHILGIKILISNYEDIQEVQELVLEIPLAS